MIQKFKWPILLLAAAGVTMLALNFSPALAPKREKEYFLKAERPGALRLLAREMKADGILHSERLFRLATRLTASDRKLQSGYYTFDNRMGLLAALGKIRRGEVNRVPVVIREGADLYEIAAEAALARAVETPAEFLEKARARALLERIEKRFTLDRKIPSVEGFLYPDTYSVRKGAGFQELADLAVARFDSRIAAAYRKKSEEMAARKERPQNLWHYLRAASLIERETPTESERPVVASVLENRLRLGEKLRFDPTILYAMKLEGKWPKSPLSTNGNVGVSIKTEHFAIKSRWNTYWVSGLPMGPICNPTLSSFEAAMEPAKTDYLFFVAKGFGVREHAFSKTYEEHQRLTKKYLLR
ncbi:MAG: endolytic transglycosylase MltG [Spirochaetes bacterium]|nr:endolytic transglycosylase MltG [Spirochaetota bacterium]